jgi:hypothetical protein
VVILIYVLIGRDYNKFVRISKSRIIFIFASLSGVIYVVWFIDAQACNGRADQKGLAADRYFGKTVCGKADNARLAIQKWPTRIRKRDG